LGDNKICQIPYEREKESKSERSLENKPPAFVSSVWF
jgi:hypothetical protein